MNFYDFGTQNIIIPNYFYSCKSCIIVSEDRRAGQTYYVCIPDFYKSKNRNCIDNSEKKSKKEINHTKCLNYIMK